jgi:hypothetical protein
VSSVTSERKGAKKTRGRFFSKNSAVRWQVEIFIPPPGGEELAAIDETINQRNVHLQGGEGGGMFTRCGCHGNGFSFIITPGA